MKINNREKEYGYKVRQSFRMQNDKVQLPLINSNCLEHYDAYVRFGSNTSITCYDVNTQQVFDMCLHPNLIFLLIPTQAFFMSLYSQKSLSLSHRHMCARAHRWQVVFRRSCLLIAKKLMGNFFFLGLLGSIFFLSLACFYLFVYLLLSLI